MIGPHIIAFVGKAGSGKSTAAQYLAVQHGFRIVKFAAPLKRMLSAVGLDTEEIEGSLKQQPCDRLMGQTPRHAMQTLGTEWGRNCIHPDFWVNLWAMEVETKRLVAVDDCRFQNEAEAVRDFGGAIIEIRRPSLVIDENVDRHASEAGVGIEPDYVIINDGPPRKLFEQVFEVSMKKGRKRG